MEYKKELNIDGTVYTFLLDEQCEFMFYTFNKKYDPMATWGENGRSFNNLHGKANMFSLFIEIQKYIRYLFSQGVSYFYFSCERERFEIYNYFITRLLKGGKYTTTIDRVNNKFYVYKSL